MKRNKWFLLIAAVCILLFSSCDLILGLFAGKGIVTGVVYDAGTNSRVAGVTVTVVGSSESTVTNALGEFELELPEGSQTLHFTLTGYVFYDVVVEVVVDDTVILDEDIVGYDPIVGDDIRIVLTWGADPDDLDSHLLVPIINEEVYYSDEYTSDNTANLDWDDTDGYGPETITITTQKSGTYQYSVYNYAQYGSFVTGGATVRVYNSTGLWKTYYASSATGDGTSDWWRVFTLNGGTITQVGTFSDTAGTSWAGIE